MHTREKRVLLRHYLEQGVSKAELARRLGVSRRTIYHWIETGQLDRDLDDEVARYGPRPPATTKLDPFKGIIETRLETFPELTAQRLFEEVRAAGYSGGYTQVKAHVRSVRPQKPVEPVVRFETPPGYQGQVDFGTFKLPWGRRHALLVVLGYSRLLWLQFFARQTMEVLFAGLEAAFQFFGGVPEELLFDQMRTVVTADERGTEGGGLVMNAQFLRFAAHWGFRPRACRPYRACTKGKVERPIRYCRQSFFYGREFVSDDDLNDQAARWRDTVANVRLHRTIGEAPRQRFERDELSTLKPLAPQPYPRLGALPQRCRAVPRVEGVAVEKRPLSVYAEAVR
jgi:transposase